MKDFNEYRNKFEKLAKETLNRVFEVSAEEMGDEAPELIKEWREKGDEGFQWMIEAIEEVLEKVAFDINQVVQERMDYLPDPDHEAYIAEFKEE